MVTQKGTWSRGKWRKRKFTTDFLEAVVREGADELTLRADEKDTLRTFIDTTNVGERKDGNHRSWVKLWSLKKAKDKGANFYDLGSVQKIQTRSQVRLGFWAIHMKSPTTVRHAGTWVLCLKKTNNSGLDAHHKTSPAQPMSRKVKAAPTTPHHTVPRHFRFFVKRSSTQLRRALPTRKAEGRSKQVLSEGEQKKAFRRVGLCRHRLSSPERAEQSLQTVQSENSKADIVATI